MLASLHPSLSFDSDRLLDRVMCVAVACIALIGFCYPQALLQLCPPCLWKTLFHIDWCWGCGITRAMLSVLAGDWRGAIQFNPLIVLVAPLSAWVYVRFVISSFRGPHNLKQSRATGGRRYIMS